MIQILTSADGSVSFVGPHGADQLRRLMTHAVISFSGYRRHFEAAGITQASVHLDTLGAFAALPATNKKAYASLQADSLQNQRARRFVVDPSSGTTGVPVLKFTSPGDDASEAAAVEFAFRQLGIAADDRVVCLDVGASQIYLFYMDVLSRLGVRDLVFVKVTSDHEHAVRLVSSIDPTLIISIPSVLKRCLKAFRTAPRLRNRPRRLIFIGEPMESALRLELDEVLGVECFSFYGTTEIGSICIECSAHAGMHVPLDLFIPTLSPWPAGSDCQISPTQYRGTICWTPLLMRGQPVIKYEVNDLVDIDFAPCLCGSNWPLLRFDSRIDETFFLYGITFTYEFFLEIIEDAVGEPIELEIVVRHHADAENGITDSISLELDKSCEPHIRAIEDAVRTVHPLSELIWSNLVEVVIDFSKEHFANRRKGRRVRRVEISKPGADLSM